MAPPWPLAQPVASATGPATAITSSKRILGATN
jgi:hypothetical protein